MWREAVCNPCVKVVRACRDPGDPLTPCLGQLLEVFCAIEGAVCYEGGRARGRVELLDVLGDDLAKGLPVAAMATEGAHQQGNPRLVLDNEVQHDLVEVWAMITAVATRDVHHLGLRLLSTVVAAIDVEAGAIEMGKSWCQPEALRRRRRNETGEFRDTIIIEQLQGASQRVIMEMLGLDPRGDEALRRFILKKPGHERELLVHKAEPIEDHRFDGAAYGDNAGLWRVLHRPVEYVADTKFVKHPGYETEMIQDLTPGSSVHRRLLSMRRFYRHTVITQIDSGECGKANVTKTLGKRLSVGFRVVLSLISIWNRGSVYPVRYLMR